MPNIIVDSEILQVASFILNIIFITYGITSFFQGRSHKRELANIFNSEYKAAKSLADSISTKDKNNSRLQVEHLAEFLKSATRNLTGRRYDEVGGEHHNFLIRWLEFFLTKKK